MIFRCSKMFSKGDDRLKCEIIIDPTCEERVVVYAKEKTALVKEIEKLAKEETELLGYRENEIVKLDPNGIECVSVINNKVYAVCHNERYALKERLYTLEEKLPQNFVKINQSCLANVAKIERFDTSISGTLKIRFKGGHTDYVSRRQLKNVKERIGI